MDTSLATNGLGEFTLPAANTDAVGVDTAKVNTVITNLEAKVTELTTLATDLETSGNEIMTGWEGAAKDQFSADYPAFLDAFGEVPKSIESLKAWTESVNTGYDKIDKEMEEKLQKALGQK